MLEAMQGDLLESQIEQSVAVNKNIIMGSTHVSKLPCGIAGNHLIAKCTGCLPLLRV